jgi:asparagine synthase (glutamine-hydrolysing)
LDLSEGANQPFHDPSGRYVLVYNGEVYNFWELRRELETLGHEFCTRCDTEVVLKGCIEFGALTFARRLKGMFAFGLWDRHEHELTLVRDRFGIKPLAVLQRGDRVIFASEIKAMRPWVDLEPNRDALLGFLAGFGGPTRDNSFFRDVRILAPGSVMKVRPDTSIDRSSFFRLPEFWDPDRFEELQARSPGQIVDELDERLTESVKLHLLADAPVGAFCSGGIDSSLVMAMAAKIHPNLAIFHANVKGPLS